MSEVNETSELEVDEHLVEADSPSRRRFLSFLAGALVTATGAGILAPLAGMFLAPLLQRRRETWLALGDVDEIPPDQPKKFVYRYVKMDGWFEKTVYGTAYAVRNGSDLIVLSNICTHLGCGVRWDPEKGAFLCPCHNGVFDRNGNVVSGPPPRPLDRFANRIAKGKIEIKVEEGQAG